MPSKIKTPTRKGSPDSVSDTRAGDQFHYRWAARRCLGMIHPTSRILNLKIEGSHENEAEGEFVIDVSEYSQAKGGKKEVTYFQLKHSNKRKDKAFQFSELKKTLTGFGARFTELQKARKANPDLGAIKFSIITNRRIDPGIKKGFSDLASGQPVDPKVLPKIESTTGLKGGSLKQFAAAIEFSDSEGDFNSQKRDLQGDLSKYLSEPADEALLNNFVSLVSDKVTAENRVITREEVLKRLGTSSEKDFYPAPPEFEDVSGYIKREQHATLLSKILKATSPVILHAGGGVGKSVTSLQLAQSLPEGSVGLVYDCFGAGKYRKPNEPRHRYRDALVQMANELSAKALCEPLLRTHADSDDGILRAFLARVASAASLIKTKNPRAVLALFVDAADNAEIAAEAFGDRCFAANLLKVDVPAGCRLIAVSRTERVSDYLKPLSSVQQVKLENFNLNESLGHLRSLFPDATLADGQEFLRLTGGNPRVQANALAIKGATLQEVLHSFGPHGTTVNEQIAAQISSAVTKTKETFPDGFANQVDQICYGLANLPPFVPIEILATAAGVPSAAVESFVSDLGRPLWITDDSVQFRDEPTETWFRDTYSEDTKVSQYLDRLIPLASSSPYVAEALPSLYLKAKRYNELIQLALSDDHLPENSPIDRRNIRVDRLQFAFRAALREKRYADATRLAMRAGEEMAGNDRQLSLLKDNLDLIAPLLAKERVEELGRRRMLGGTWIGSENVYSAAVLSSVHAFKGEARSYLRSANNWLDLYFQDLKKGPQPPHRDSLSDQDILEMAYAHFNLSGPEALVRFASSWTPHDLAYKIARGITRRLVDIADYASIEKIAKAGQANPYIIVGISEQLSEVGRFLPAKLLVSTLNRLSQKRTRIQAPDPHVYERPIVPAIVSFTEACTNRKLSARNILSVVRHYVPERGGRGVASDHQTKDERHTFLRARALENMLKKVKGMDLDKLLPIHLKSPGDSYDKRGEISEFKAVVGQLLPWYRLRAKTIASGSIKLSSEVESAKTASQKEKGSGYKHHDPVPREISHVRYEILCFNKKATAEDIADFKRHIASEGANPFIRGRLHALRCAHRLEHLAGIRLELETELEREIQSVLKSPEERPDSISADYVSLARAVLPSSAEDAKVYFDRAIEVGSKFGDESVQRWEAVVALAERTADGGQVEPELAYRLTRCMDAVGETAEEKHFSREHCAVVAQRLHFGSGFAAISRWRDRDVGWRGFMLGVLAHECLRTKMLSVRALWSLTAFQSIGIVHEFADKCLEIETNPTFRQQILDETVRRLRLSRESDTELWHWSKLKEVAEKHSLQNAELSEAVTFFSAAAKKKKSNDHLLAGQSKEQAPFAWDKIFADIDLQTPAGISEGFKRFKAAEHPKEFDEFWAQAYARIDKKYVRKFLEDVVQAESVDEYHIHDAISKLPPEWRGKVSVKEVMPTLIKSIGKRFPLAMVSPYLRERLLEAVTDTSNAEASLRSGILEGLSQYTDIIDARAFFCFPDIVRAEITPTEAKTLLDYVLKRFEEHIGPETGDGDWHPRFTPPTDPIEAFTGFIWASLGSPETSIRWQAMHCVRKLAESGCAKEIDSLVSWMERGAAEAFCGRNFPFYYLHARQSQLMALARVAIDNPSALRTHSPVFKKYALGEVPHAMIQHFAARIAILIEAAHPGAYSATDVAALKAVGKSPFPPNTSLGYRDTVNSPWHKKGEIDQTERVYFGFDDDDWLDPLGRVFGIPGRQVRDLAQDFALNTLKVPVENKHVVDPRNWRNRDGTWDRHSYPALHTYTFYALYHSLMATASRLLQNMPAVHDEHGLYGGFENYFQWHLPGRADGKWLADRRDIPPLERREWIYDYRTEGWKGGIGEADFLNTLLRPGDGEKWLNIFGHWNEIEGDREETFDVSSALVNPETSQALLESLSDPEQHTYLPRYGDEDHEYNEAPFDLSGWIGVGSMDNREIDRFDPHGGDISYPPFKVGEAIAERLGLTSDPEYREWRLPGRATPALICKLWGEIRRGRRDEETTKSGHQLRASLGLLKHLCVTLQKDLIIEVRVGRNYTRHYRRKDDEGTYAQPKAKIFLLTKEGILRDTGKSYPIG